MCGRNAIIRRKIGLLGHIPELPLSLSTFASDGASREEAGEFSQNLEFLG